MERVDVDEGQSDFRREEEEGLASESDGQMAQQGVSVGG
jgi:hypothetical protein